jgi:hypothetical protein
MKQGSDEKVFKILIGVLCIFLLYVIIAVVWQQAELKLYGKITPRKLDDVIAVILAISLYFNFK